MAHIKDNIVTEGMSGKLGNKIVFRNVGGKTIVAKRPTPSGKEDTEEQKKHKLRFRTGAIYAKKAIQDPILREAYGARAKPGQSPYNVAMADFFNAPEIIEVDLSFFTGVKGSPLVVQVVDDHEVIEVKVAIYDPQGGLLEEGPATLHENGINWVYTTQKAITTISGHTLSIQATDQPGNKVEREEVLS